MSSGHSAGSLAVSAPLARNEMESDQPGAPSPRFAATIRLLQQRLKEYDTKRARARFQSALVRGAAAGGCSEWNPLDCRAPSTPVHWPKQSKALCRAAGQASRACSQAPPTAPERPANRPAPPAAQGWRRAAGCTWSATCWACWRRGGGGGRAAASARAAGGPARGTSWRTRCAGAPS